MHHSHHICISGMQSAGKELSCDVLQGSVLGPILFILYTVSLGKFLCEQGIPYHLYADVTQLYIAFDHTSITETVSKMEQCINFVKNWMNDYILKMNESKLRCW